MAITLLHDLEPGMRLTLPCGTTAIAVGDMLYITSNAVLPMTAVTHDANFVGIADGAAEATVDSGKEIPIITVGIFRAALSSAAYAFGAGLLWVDASTLETDGAAANTIAWFYGDEASAVTSGKIYINIPLLAIVGKQFTIPKA